MANQRVQQVTTPISEAEMAQALIHATQKLYGIDLSKEQVSLLIAQNNLETNHRKGMHNYNIGNITHNEHDSWDYYMGDDKTKDSHGNWKPTSFKFRSYPNLETAAQDYVRNIHNRAGGRVWQQIMNADVHGFSQELKKSHYYEADEKDYTKALVGGVNAFNKSNSFELAQSGQVNRSPAAATNVAYNDAGGSGMVDKLENMLNKFLSTIASEDLKRLPLNLIKVEVYSADRVDALEYSRILSLALEEEAQATSSIYSDGKNVELLCEIAGPESTCVAAVAQLSKVLASTFKTATKKIGGVEIITSVSLNKTSNYQELDIKLAQLAYRQFHLKFIK